MKYVLIFIGFLTLFIFGYIAQKHGFHLECSEGFVKIQNRCCSKGQRLSHDLCEGRPVFCPANMDVENNGCVSKFQQVEINEGFLQTGSGDWEANNFQTNAKIWVHPFRMDSTEVTVKRYEECVLAGPCNRVEFLKEPGMPVTNITFDEARRYCQYVKGDLPTEEQFQMAMSGQESRRYPWGNTGAVCRRLGWGRKNGPCSFGATGPELAGSHPSGNSENGVYDLSGNVAEWTRPSNEVFSDKVQIRGGSWEDDSVVLIRSWSWKDVPKETRSRSIGFRCAYKQ